MTTTKGPVSGPQCVCGCTRIAEVLTTATATPVLSWIETDAGWRPYTIKDRAAETEALPIAYTCIDCLRAVNLSILPIANIATAVAPVAAPWWDVNRWNPVFTAGVLSALILLAGYLFGRGVQ